MQTIEDRLKFERKRLGLTQDGLAQRAGVNRTAQVRYEKGESFPDAKYLAAVAPLGVDVQFVVTGVRQGDLDEAESDLLKHFRGASPEMRSAVLSVLKATSVGFGAGTIMPGSTVGQVFAGKVRQDNLTINVGGAGRKRGKASS